MPLIRIEVPDHVAARAAYVKAAKNLTLPSVYAAMLVVSAGDQPLDDFAETILTVAMQLAAQKQMRQPQPPKASKRRVRAGHV